MAETLGPAKVVFACVANAGRSQMAAAFFNTLANPARARAISAGTRPERAVHPGSRDGDAGARHRSVRRHARNTSPRISRRTRISSSRWDAATNARSIPGVERDDWPLDDPKDKPLETVRRIRDEIKKRVVELVKERKWK